MAARYVPAAGRVGSTQTGRTPGLVRTAGFCDVRVYGRLRTVWGTLELLEARKRD